MEFRPIKIGLGTISFGGQLRISEDKSKVKRYNIGLKHLAQGYETVWDFELSRMLIKQTGQLEIRNTGLAAYAQNSRIFSNWMQCKLGLGYATRFDLADNAETQKALSVDAGVRILLGRTRLQLVGNISVLPGMLGRDIILERDFRVTRLRIRYEKYGDWEELSAGITYTVGY